MYKYLTGEFQSMEDALTEKSKMLEQGLKELLLSPIEVIRG